MKRSKKELEEIKKYKDYPEDSVYREVYDSVFLPFSEYLEKYYKNLKLTRSKSWQSWERWQKKYLEPAFDADRHEEMIKNFGYVSIDKHDFESQYRVYNGLKSDKRLDEETRRFIGFLAGNHFFDTYDISVEEWLTMKNWNRPFDKKEEGRTIDEILSYQYGLNMLKCSLLQMPYWKRF